MQRYVSIRFGQRARLCAFRWIFAVHAVAGVSHLAAASVPSSSSSASAPHSPTHTSHSAQHVAHKSSGKPTVHSNAAHSATTAAHGKASPHGKKTSKAASKGSKPPTKSAKRGQQAIDPSRAREIQEALIREHYLDGEPSGSWDGTTQAAMQRYQEDQGWQSKTTPDSRALIKLGLGPSHEHLLNPESAMTMPAAPLSADPKRAAKQAAAEGSTPQQ